MNQKTVTVCIPDDSVRLKTALTESWRQQPGSPAYCTELTAPELRAALGRTAKGRSPGLRELSHKRLDAFGDGFLASLGVGEYTLGYTSKDVVRVYRELESTRVGE
ncbi:hypothetical protein [Sphingomonas sp. CFBP 8760]|uniref:hypothetical protein n=1 Tax=Sphingomonas sp. CFBP 8760 TaxID=2775282 RepID=UPI0018FEAA05|nr:hypothetical protein [Sphingomonas sp. CFBP 8760]